MRRPAVPWRRTSRRLLVLAAALGLSGGLLAAPPVPAAAADCPLAPQLREAVVNQGIAGYTSLVRGKTTVVKAYLAKPACATINDRIEVLGAKLTVVFGGVNQTVTTAVVGPVFPEVLPSTAAPSPDAPADPVFQVPGSYLDGVGDGPAPATFEVRVSYRATTAAGAVTTVQDHLVTSSPGTPTTTATFQPRPNAIRILAVPFGRPDQPFTDWWPSPAGDDALLKSLQAYGRMSPLRDGVGSMTSDAGIRYHRAPNVLDVRPYLVNGKFCGSNGTFDPIRAKLETFVSVWNDANPLDPVDKALGVAWHGKSLGPSESTACADGYATVGGDHAWARIVPDTSSTALARGGALIGMELGHALGGVPAHRDDPFDGFHSVASANAGTRGVNTMTGKYLSSPPSVMKYSTSGWNDYTVLHRVEDWEFAQCVLTPVSTGSCGLSQGSVGTAAATANTYSLSGSTDGTPAGTHVHSFESPSADSRPLAGEGDFSVVQRNTAEQQVAVGYFDTGNDTSQHSGEESDSHAHAAQGTFNVSVPRAPGADRFELWNVRDPAAPVLLYRRVLDAAPVVRPRHVERVATAPVNRTAGLGGGSSPSLSPDGGLLAYATGGSLRLLDLDSGAAGSGSLTGTDPVLFTRADGTTHVAFVRNGDLHLAPVARPAGGAPSFGAPTVVYSRHAQVDLLGAPAGRPAVLGDGAAIVTSIQQGSGATAQHNLWRIDLSGAGLGPNGTVCQLQPTELARCRRVSDGGADVEPAAAAADRVLFRRGTAVRVLDLSGSSPAVLASPSLGAAAEPSVGGATVAVRDTTSGGIDLASATSLGERSGATTGADSLPSLAGNRLAFARSGEAGGSDVWTVELMHGSEISFEATDRDPQQLRADVYLTCGDGLVQPAFVGEPATSYDEASRSATWTLQLDDAAACPGGELTGRVTDGYSSTRFDIGVVPGSPTRRAAVYAPAPGSTVLQYDTVALQGEALDALGQPLGGLSYVTTSETPGVSFNRTTPYVPGTPSQLAPDVPGGWTPGATYRVDLVQGTTVLASSRFTAVADGDHDGLPPHREVGPCFAPDADRDPRNAGLDPDGDGESNLVDLTPCGLGATNVTVRFDPDELRSSSGTPVTLYLTGSEVDLRTIDPASVLVTDVGAVRVSIPRMKWAVTDARTAMAQFDRQALLRVVDQHRLRGYVPVVVRGSSRATAVAFGGFDPDDPVVS